MTDQDWHELGKIIERSDHMYLVQTEGGYRLESTNGWCADPAQFLMFNRMQKEENL